MLLLSWQLHAVPPSQIQFANLNENITLTKVGEQYHLNATKQRVQLTNRLIVKTPVSSSKSDVKNYHDDIKQVTSLYQGSRFNYYLITAKSADFPARLFNALKGKQFQPQSNILLVQPDILQIKTKAAHETADTTNTANTTDTRTITRAPYFSSLGVKSYWQKSQGEGINIAVIDDGFDLTHPDLKHLTPIFSYDAETRQQVAAPLSRKDKHGTKVAGIIFAAHNKIGIDGLAPKANLIAIRQPDTWTSNTLLSFQLAKLANADIINCSWHSNWLLEPISDIVNDLAKNGRNGKGTAVIWAAGNKGLELTHNYHEAAIKSAVTIGAVNSQQQKMKFSNFGQAIDVFTYGDAAQTTIVPNRRGREYGNFSGTSLAAAVTSGLAALLLSVQPELTLAQLVTKLKEITKTNQVSLTRDR